MRFVFFSSPRFHRPSVVRLGEVDFESVDESQAFDYDVAAVRVHEGYVLPMRYNDIAIITLKQKVGVFMLGLNYVYFVCMYIHLSPSVSFSLLMASIL